MDWTVRQTGHAWLRQRWATQPVRLAVVSTCFVALLTLPAYGPTAGALVADTLGGARQPAASASPEVAAPVAATSYSIPVTGGWVHGAMGGAAPLGTGKTPFIRLTSEDTDPIFRRDIASLDELGLINGTETAQWPVLAQFGDQRARLQPFLGGSLALTQSYADEGHNRLIVITDPKAVIKFQGTAGLSLLSGEMSELQVFYRYIKFTDPSLRPSASLLALTDSLTSSQRQHEVMMGWRLKF